MENCLPDQQTPSPGLTADHVAQAARVMAMAALGVAQTCRRCGEPLSARVVDSFMAGQRVKCSACEWRGTWREGTILHGSFLTEVQFVALFYRFSLPESTPQVAGIMHLHPATVREWQRRIALHVEKAA